MTKIGLTLWDLIRDELADINYASCANDDFPIEAATDSIIKILETQGVEIPIWTKFVRWLTDEQINYVYTLVVEHKDCRGIATAFWEKWSGDRNQFGIIQNYYMASSEDLGRQLCNAAAYRMNRLSHRLAVNPTTNETVTVPEGGVMPDGFRWF